jgi:hypothetical protein
MAAASPYRGSLLTLGAVGLVVVGLAGCNKPPQVVQGECRPVNGADVCTWGEMSGNALVSFGATVPMGAVQNAPADEPMVWPPVAAAIIPLPEAVSTATGFKDMTVYWEPHGHPPGPYLVPHFDFHFNTVSINDLNTIDCADSTKPSQLPAAYELPDVAIPGMGTLVGLCVPQMGMHALLGSELRSPTTFQKTMIVGYYRAKPIFLEPMITSASLLERHSFRMDIPAVPDVATGTRYPTTFRADYDSTTQAYKFVFSGFTAAGAQ